MSSHKVLIFLSFPTEGHPHKLHSILSKGTHRVRTSNFTVDDTDIESVRSYLHKLFIVTRVSYRSLPKGRNLDSPLDSLLIFFGAVPVPKPTFLIMLSPTSCELRVSSFHLTLRDVPSWESHRTPWPEILPQSPLTGLSSVLSLRSQVYTFHRPVPSKIRNLSA